MQTVFRDGTSKTAQIVAALHTTDECLYQAEALNTNDAAVARLHKTHIHRQTDIHPWSVLAF